MGRSSDMLWQQLATPDVKTALLQVEQIAGMMLPYQMAALHELARQYDGGAILEIGTLSGRSALVMGLAAPNAKVVTLTPSVAQAMVAKGCTGGHNVEVIVTTSQHYLRQNADIWDMVFVDGDHNQVDADLPWFDRLRVGGLMLFHDFTPHVAGVARKGSPKVVDAVDRMAAQLDRVPDVLLIDDVQIGMAGFYRQAEDITVV